MAEWRKVIPESRDRLQSNVLVWVVVPMLLYFAIRDLTSGLREGSGCYSGVLTMIGLSVTLAVFVWLRRSGTGPAAAVGGVICFLITLHTASCRSVALRSGFAPLMAMMVLTLGATKAGRRIKERRRLAEDHMGRNAAQVVANLGMAALSFELTGIVDRYTVMGKEYVYFTIIPALMVAALAEATADTVSSEIGQAFGGTPVMLTTFRRVEAGTDGAVTVLGTVAGILGAAAVAGVGMWAMRMSFAVAGIGLAGGVAGLFFDSLLGATAERKGWLGNDLVNFSSTVFAVVVAMGLALVFLHLEW